MDLREIKSSFPTEDLPASQAALNVLNGLSGFAYLRVRLQRVLFNNTQRGTRWGCHRTLGPFCFPEPRNITWGRAPSTALQARAHQRAGGAGPGTPRTTQGGGRDAKPGRAEPSRALPPSCPPRPPYGRDAVAPPGPATTDGA